MKIIRYIILIVLFAILLRFVFVVRRVECLLPTAVLEDGVCSRINTFFKGSALLFTDFENASVWEDLLSNQEYSQAYQYQTVSKSLSGLVTLTLVSKLPDYRLTTSQGSYLLNQSNKLRNDRADLTLPTIEAEIDQTSLETGYLSDDLHQRFLALAQALSKYDFVTSRVRWLSDQEIQLQVENLLVLLDTSKTFVYQIERLRVILDDQKLQSTIAANRTLDLRFNLPVLK